MFKFENHGIFSRKCASNRSSQIDQEVQRIHGYGKHTICKMDMENNHLDQWLNSLLNKIA